MRKLDIGIASYENPSALDRTLTALRQTTQTDCRILVIDNASPDPAVKQVIVEHAGEDSRVQYIQLGKNTGYAGAVNHLLDTAETEYVAYCDNDCQPLTVGWDEMMASLLDIYHEIGMLFPISYVHFPISRPPYMEVLWGVGCAWVLNRMAAKDAWSEKERYFDEALGHHEEVDFQTRLRLAGWKIAAHTAVHVRHEAHRSRSQEAQERMNRGVVNWVNKWEAYFGGKGQNCSSPNVMRFDLWPPHALYLEEYFISVLGGMNAEPEEVKIGSREYDLIKVPRLRNMYRGRVI